MVTVRHHKVTIASPRVKNTSSNAPSPLHHQVALFYAFARVLFYMLCMFSENPI